MNTIKKMIISLVILLTIIALFNLEKIYRLHAIITLFDQEKIVSNFSNMEQATLSLPILKNLSDARRRQLVRCYLQMDGVYLGRHGMAIVEPAYKPAVPLLRRTVWAYLMMVNWFYYEEIGYVSRF